MDRNLVLAQLCGAIRDGSPSEEEAAKLDAMLASDEEARSYYLKFMQVHALLERYPIEAGEVLGAGFEGEDESEKVIVFSRRWFVGVLAAAAAVVIGLIATGVIDVFPEKGGGSYLAVVTRSEGADWFQNGQPSDVGAGLQEGMLELRSGELEIEFDSGAVVILRGSTRFELRSDRHAVLHEGQLAAHVPPQAKGFTVDGPGMAVVDLGTEFAFNVSPEGVADVHVFEGEVETILDGENNGPVKLFAKETRRLDPRRGEVSEVAFDPEAFTHPPVGGEKMPEVSGRIRLLKNAPMNVKAGRFQHDYVLLFREAEGAMLGEDLEVTVNSPGRHLFVAEKINGEEGVVAKGTVVTSYFLHFDSPKTDTSRASGTITFEAPIVGIIANRGHLATSDKLLGNAGTNYRSQSNRVLEGDLCTISADRKTLTLNWGVARDGVDQIRVVVEGE